MKTGQRCPFIQGEATHRKLKDPLETKSRFLLLLIRGEQAVPTAGLKGRPGRVTSGNEMPSQATACTNIFVNRLDRVLGEEKTQAEFTEENED